MTVSIVVNGTKYTDVVQASVRFSMDEMAHSFNLTFTDRWFYSGNQKFPFDEGHKCELYVNNKKCITGFIDNIGISYSSSDHSIQVSGRSMGGILVDSSAQHKTGAWTQAVPKVIIDDLLSPHGISFSYDPSIPSDVPTQKLRKFAIEQEETVFEAIGRIAKLKGFFVISDSNGNLVGTRAGKKLSNTIVKKGVNIISGSREGRFQDRYSIYIVKAQNAGDDTWFAEDATSKLFAQVKDSAVPIHKPLIIVSDTQGSKKELELRAEWERNIRAGRSKKLTYTLNEFEQDNGDLWTINQQVYVIDPFFDVYGVMLASTVEFQYGMNGSFTTMELIRPEAYDILVEPQKNKKGWA